MRLSPNSVTAKFLGGDEMCGAIFFLEGRKSDEFVFGVTDVKVLKSVRERGVLLARSDGSRAFC